MTLNDATTPGDLTDDVQVMQSFQPLLNGLADAPNGLGVVVVSNDGFLLDSALPPDCDVETTAILSLGVQVNTANISRKMGCSLPSVMVFRTTLGWCILVSVTDVVLMAFYSLATETVEVFGLVEKIRTLASQSAQAV